MVWRSVYSLRSSDIDCFSRRSACARARSTEFALFFGARVHGGFRGIQSEDEIRFHFAAAAETPGRAADFLEESVFESAVQIEFRTQGRHSDISSDSSCSRGWTKSPAANRAVLTVFCEDAVRPASVAGTATVGPVEFVRSGRRSCPGSLVGCADLDICLGEALRLQDRHRGARVLSCKLLKMRGKF